MLETWCDKGRMLRLNMSDVLAYLRENGWRAENPPHGKWSIWTRDDGEVELLCPLSREFRDYGRRMAELVGNLAIYEERDPLAVYSDLLFSSADVISIRQTGHGTEDHTLSLEESESKAGYLRNMMSAAAIAANTRKMQAVYSGRQSQTVTDYLRRVRIGMEAGSVVWNIISRVHSEPRDKGATLFSEADDTPFPRKVTAMLADSLQIMMRAAAEAAATGDMRLFNEGVRHGVSANLCEAVSGLVFGDSDICVETGFKWSCALPLDNKLPRRLIFDQGHIETLSAAAHSFREKEPIEDMELVGWIVTLDQRDEGAFEEGALKGIVRSIGGGHPLDVHISINAINREMAMAAFKEQIKIRMSGTFRKAGKKYLLDSPRDFQLVDE